MHGQLQTAPIESREPLTRVGRLGASFAHALSFPFGVGMSFFDIPLPSGMSFSSSGQKAALRPQYVTSDGVN